MSAFFIFFILFSFNVEAQNNSIKIAILDTGFCLKKSPLNTSKNISIKSVLDFYQSKTDPCTDSKSARLHGQKTLETFINAYKGNLKLEIYPVILFNERGIQTMDVWKKALGWVKKNEIHFVLSSVAFVQKTPFLTPIEIPAIWFLASGQTGPFIKKNVQLFPHDRLPLKNVFLIGSFNEVEKSIFYQQNLLYQNKIDYYFSGIGDDFSGSSKAAPLAMAKAFSICHDQLKNLDNLRSCLLKKRRVLNDQRAKKIFYTY